MPARDKEGEVNEKMNSIVFKAWKTRKLLKKKKKKMKKQTFLKIGSKELLEKLLFANQSLAFIDSSSLVKKTF